MILDWPAFFVILGLALCTGSGLASAEIAERRGVPDPTRLFWVGVLLPVVGLVAALLMAGSDVPARTQPPA
jgi:hypothetical protein